MNFPLLRSNTTPCVYRHTQYDHSINGFGQTVMSSTVAVTDCTPPVPVADISDMARFHPSIPFPATKGRQNSSGNAL